jgi:hypothetical protein
MRLKRLEGMHFRGSNQRTLARGVVTHLIPIPNQSKRHKKFRAIFEISMQFGMARESIVSAVEKRSNHDLVQFNLFKKILEEIPQRNLVVLEFGTWRGAFIESLAIDANMLNKKINYFGFDTFDKFPFVVGVPEAQNIYKLEKHLSLVAPYSVTKLQNILGKYSDNLELNLLPGDIRETVSEVKSIVPDIVFFDMDYAFAFDLVVEHLTLTEKTIFIVDDYYQPSWFSLTLAVNAFCSKRGLVPVNISDYFGVPRTPRTQYTVVLIPTMRKKRTPGVDFTVE